MEVPSKNRLVDVQSDSMSTFIVEYISEVKSIFLHVVVVYIYTECPARRRSVQMVSKNAWR